MIWLNNCGTTPAPRDAILSVSRFLEGYSLNGIFTDRETFSEVKRTIKQFLVSLLGGDSSEYAFIHNTSEGMNILSYGITLPPNSRILLLENEYPSNVYPFQHLQSLGHTIEFVSVGNSPEEFWESFMNKLVPSTALVSFSAVHWCTGMPLPLEKIGKVCKEKDIIFAVDGAQGVGHIPIDVKKMKIDFLAFSAWKWLLGPLGMGILYVSSDFLHKLKVSFKGTESVRDSETYLPYRDTYKDGAERYTISTPSFVDWVYLKSSLKLLSEYRYPNVFEKIYELTNSLGELLKELGYSLNTDAFQEKTGILVAKKESISADRVVEYLRTNKVITASRLGGIRFSPHIYNSPEQFHQVYELLKRFD